MQTDAGMREAAMIGRCLHGKNRMAVTVCATWVSILLAAVGALAADWNIGLPADGTGFKFGKEEIPELKNVTSQSLFKDQAGFGFMSVSGISQNDASWPDALSGGFLSSDKELEFRAKVPNGRYLVWMCAGKIIRADIKERRYLLKINDATVCDERPGEEEFWSEKYLYRFMMTQYSERPHAIWEDFIDRMYSSTQSVATVSDGILSVKSMNYFLSALIVAPEKEAAAFDRVLSGIKAKRVEDFEKTLKPLPFPKPSKKEGDGDYVIFVPDIGAELMPWTAPTDEERKRMSIKSAGTPGERVIMKVGIVPFADLGKSSIEVSDLKGPETIAASRIRVLFRNFRFNGSDYDPQHPERALTALIPTLSVNAERGVTRFFYLLLSVPDNAKAGVYTGVFKFKPGKGKPSDMPVELEVYPFRLDGNLPFAFGMWWTSGFNEPAFSDPAALRKFRKEQLESMREEIGLTTITVPGFQFRRIVGDKVEIALDTTWYDLARETGMARNPEQALLVGNLWGDSGRSLKRFLSDDARQRMARQEAKIPGLADLTDNPEFNKYMTEGCRQYRELLKKMGLPVVVNAVDEPRERDAYNKREMKSYRLNLAGTLVMCDLMRDAELSVPALSRISVNPMADINYDKVSYLPILDHVDLISTHGSDRSEQFMRQTVERGKTLWVYNIGQDRYTWGFYNWRVQSKGRWEWCFWGHSNSAQSGYPGREWYNPFTGMTGVGAWNGVACCAPYTACKGGVLYLPQAYDMREGVTDAAYLYTLGELLKKPELARSKKGEEALAFLASLEKAIPFLPKKVKGMAGPNAGQMVGRGTEDEARLRVAEWRNTIAGFLKELAK